MRKLAKLLFDEQGQDLIEYVLLLAFVALASAALFVSSGQSVGGIWAAANSQLAKGGPCNDLNNSNLCND